MCMLEIHAEALDKQLASYHEFLTRYSKTSKVVYGFVEGKDDPCFYRGFIEHMIPDDWDIELWPAGSKDQVFRIHSDMNWVTFSKDRVCFFVDRDLSEMIPENVHEDSNIYLTDGYSIENDLVKRGTCRRILTEVFGFDQVPHKKIDGVCDLFEQELETFLVAMIPVMAWILLWRRNGKRACLNDILMPHLFCFKSGKIIVNARPKRKTNSVEYIHAQCNLIVDTTADLIAAEAELRKAAAYRKFTRGKYLSWFLVAFCQSVRESANVLVGPSSKILPMHVSVSSTNGITVIGNRARLPKSLRDFLQKTYCKHIEHLNDVA